jgi:hypothetical protein
MHTLPSPAAPHTELALARFHAMQRQLHGLAAQLRALYQPDPLARLQRQQAHDLDLLQREFDDNALGASPRPIHPSGLRR